MFVWKSGDLESFRQDLVLVSVYLFKYLFFLLFYSSWRASAVHTWVFGRETVQESGGKMCSMKRERERERLGVPA